MFSLQLCVSRWHFGPLFRLSCTVFLRQLYLVQQHSPTPHSVDPKARGAAPGALRAAGRLRGAVRTRGESTEGPGSAPARGEHLVLVLPTPTMDLCLQLGTHFVSTAAPAMQGAAGWVSRVGNPSPPTLGALCAPAGPTRTPGVPLIRSSGARLPEADGQQL